MLGFTPIAQLPIADISAGVNIQQGAGTAVIEFVSAAVGISTADSSGSVLVEFIASGSGNAINDAVGAAVLEFIASSAGTGILDGAGLVELDFSADGFIWAMLDGDGAVNLDFSALGVGELHRIPIRVIIGVESGNRASTALQGLSSQLGIRAMRGQTSIASRASQTRAGLPRSRTEIN